MAIEETQPATAVEMDPAQTIEPTKADAAPTVVSAEPPAVETPVAENLMVGLAIGMSLAGLRPVVYIERMDFILNALDAIVNHLDKIAQMSHGEFNPAIILRVVVGNKHKPLFTGATHTQDFTEAVRSMVGFDVARCTSAANILAQYRYAYSAMEAQRGSTMLVENKDLI